MKQIDHAYKIASSSSSLRHIFLDIDLQKHPTYWEMERDECNHDLFTMKRICDSVGEGMIRKVQYLT